MCKEHDVGVSWVHENNFKSTDLQKTDFIVFQSFKGKVFEEVKLTKSA